MTDGIIQKAFRKEINYYIAENNKYMLDALTNIQTELIAEIKKEIIPRTNSFPNHIMEILIGDNK